MNPLARFVAWGPVRGACGHEHRSIRTAAACVACDQRGCSRVHGYSDRQVYRLGSCAERIALSLDEYREIDDGETW